MKLKIWIIGISMLLVVSSCIEEVIKKPTIESIDIDLKDVTLTTTTVDVEVTIHNPNPFGATFNKIAYDIYFQEGGRWKYMGHGEKTDKTELRANGLTTIKIPTRIDNKDAIRAIYQMLVIGKGSLPIKVSGSVYLDVKLTSIEIPFQQTRTVTL
jgi:LEA14-like dessication related protein